MTGTQTTFKYCARVGLGALAVLFVLSAVYYRERLFFADASFIAFNIIKLKSFYIQEHRYGSFITQLVPYFGCRAGMPVGYILKGYALSFNFFYLLAGLLVYRCRQYALVIVMSFYYYLLVSDTFYWANNEIHQAVAWMFIFYAVIFKMAEKKIPIFWFLPVFIVLAFVTVSTHFIVLIPLVFIWVFLWIRGQEWPWNKRLSLILSFCLAGVVGVKFLLVKDNSYDDDHLHNITHLSLKDILHAFGTPVVKEFLWCTVWNYWLWVVVFIAGIFVMWREKKTWLIGWSLLSVLGYFLLMAITFGYWTGDIVLFYIESEWQSLSVIIAVPFVYYLLPKMRWSTGVGVLSVVFIVRLVYIVDASRQFTWRYIAEKDIVTEMRKKGITKAGIYGADSLQKKCLLTWAAADESMLMSAMNKDEPQITFTFIDTGNKVLMGNLASPKYVVAAFDLATPASWNYKYFRPDTSRSYTVIAYQELMK